MACNLHDSSTEMKSYINRSSPTPSTSPKVTTLPQQQENEDKTEVQVPSQVRLKVHIQIDPKTYTRLQAQEEQLLRVHKNFHAEPHDQAREDQDQDQEAGKEGHEEEVPAHSPLAVWAYQTENVHLTIYERFEKKRWECGSGAGNGGGSDIAGGSRGNSDKGNR